MEKNDIILASASPRRIEMMKKNGYDPLVIPSRVDEDLPLPLSPASAVMYLALKKALDVRERASSGRLVIAADTVVTHGGKIIGKPADRDEAFRVLSSMRNDMHSVLTGVCIARRDEDIKICFVEKTDVYFTGYSDEELLAYVDTDEPYDKAGGYAIQGTFAKYVDHIEGDYDNVVGFPWTRISGYLRDGGENDEHGR